MGDHFANNFSTLCGELCNILYVKEYEKSKVNNLLDELNAKPFTTELFVGKHDATALLNALCLNIKPSDEALTAKASHFINNVITKQNLSFNNDFLWKVITWHLECLRKCSELILPDLLHNVQCILMHSPAAGFKFSDELVAILTDFISRDKQSANTHNPLQIILLSLKCLCAIVSVSESDENPTVSQIDKEKITQVVISFLLKGPGKQQDEFLYYKAVIAALRVLSQLYLNGTLNVPLPEVIGICRYYMVLGLFPQGARPEKVMPSQQNIAPVTPIVNKGGKKQKHRKQRNTAIESLKKDIPTDRSIMKDIDHIDNNTYKPASSSYLESKNKPIWPLTSDSDISDIENASEAKMVALRSKVRLCASNLLLVIVKVTERKDMYGYWWALLPDSPDVCIWMNDSNAKRTLAYCASADPVASCRTNVLSVILALLSGSKVFLTQAEMSKKTTTSFIPFSVTLGYSIKCLHKVLIDILDNERVYSVIIIAMKCCAALCQATPYHKIENGLISELVRSTRKYLVHKDVKLQVGALITIGCVLSIDPKSDEITKSIQKDNKTPTKNKKDTSQNITTAKDDIQSSAHNASLVDDDDDDYFDDDEMFDESSFSGDESDNFKSWVLEICFRNLGCLFRNNEVKKCKQSAIPVMLESLQVISALSYNHFTELIQPHMSLLANVLSEMLTLEHYDIVLQSAKTVSVLGDGIQKLEQSNQAPPLKPCVAFWECVLNPLSSVLQCTENPPARVYACDSLANVGERVFKELPRRTQVLCCTLLMGCCSDEETSVRAASIRALAMIVMYKTLREDICFVSDCGENILRALTESSLVVKIKAAWALGNLSGALVLNIDDPEIDCIDDHLLLRLLEVSLNCASDNDKIKMSATRCIGNILRLINEDNLSRNVKLKSLCDVAIEKLLECSNKVPIMKVRWNACYAIGNFMKNEYLFTSFNGWQRQVFKTLCSLAKDCKNIKVRINAANALRSPNSRQMFGDQYANVCNCVLEAIENAAHLDDFNEYKHKDNLIEQLCVTLAHLCRLLKTSDLQDIYDSIVFHYDSVKAISMQISSKLLPENPSCLKMLETSKYLTMNLVAKTDVQVQCLTMLQDIFIWDIGF